MQIGHSLSFPFLPQNLADFDSVLHSKFAFSSLFVCPKKIASIHPQICCFRPGLLVTRFKTNFGYENKKMLVETIHF